MFSRWIFSQFDYALFAVAILLGLLGVLGIFSATSQNPDSSAYLRQLLWVGLGVGLCPLVISIDYHVLTDHAFFIYGAAVLLLIGILFFGTEINGSKSWVSIGGVGLQPSELVKVVVILVVARYLSELNYNYVSRRDLMVVAALTGLPMLLVILQGDLGTTLVYAPIALGILLVAGLRLRVLGILLLCGLCLAPVGWYCLKDYQKQRILSTLDPSRDPSGIGYQTRQSQIAIGSGGLLGKGIGAGRQSQYGFVPEIHTDFIFALLAEEMGLIGAGAILGLYLILLMRLIKIAERARDRVGMLILSGIASMLFFHVVINVGMAVGLVPPIGIPLPLLSYGGSSTLTTFFALGIALNIYYRRYVYS